MFSTTLQGYISVTFSGILSQSPTLIKPKAKDQKEHHCIQWQLSLLCCRSNEKTLKKSWDVFVRRGNYRLPSNELMGVGGGQFFNGRHQGQARCEWVEWSMGFPRKANKVKLDPTGCAIWLQLCEGNKCRSWWRGRGGWAGMLWVSGAAQRLAKFSEGLLLPLLSPEEARSPISQEFYGGGPGSPGMRTTWLPRCRRPLISGLPEGSWLMPPIKQAPILPDLLTELGVTVPWCLSPGARPGWEGTSGPKAVQEQDFPRPEWDSELRMPRGQICILPGDLKPRGSDPGFWWETVGLQCDAFQGLRPPHYGICHTVYKMWAMLCIYTQYGV